VILRTGVLASLVALSVPAALTAAPGAVEVRDESGAVVTTLTGPDALQDAVGAVVTSRAPESRPWSIVVGAGTYGDAAIATPNLSVATEPGAAVAIGGAGLRDDTGGNCLAVTRGNVTVAGIACVAPRRTGIVVTLRNGEGGVVLSAISVDRAGVDGIAITGGRGFLVEGAVITAPARDGIRITSPSGRDARAITGGSVTGAGRDGLRLADDVRRLTVSGLTVAGSREHGIASDDAGNSDIAIEGVTVTGSGRDGVKLAGGTLRASVVASSITGNTGAGVLLGDASGLRIADIPVDGSNGGGDLVFDAEIRTGGSYTGLRAPDGPFSLVGEPNSARISGVAAARAGVASGGPARLARRGPALFVGATSRTASRRVVLRFPSGRAVYRKAGPWKRVPSSRVVRGGLQAVLGTSQLGTASTAYAPFG
jgi:hypothetical protein